jgi:hypothetical protein
MPAERLSEYVFRVYVDEAQGAIRNMSALGASPFMLAHLVVFIALGVLIGSVAGLVLDTGWQGAQLGFAGGVSIGIVIALSAMAITGLLGGRRAKQRR